MPARGHRVSITSTGDVSGPGELNRHSSPRGEAHTGFASEIESRGLCLRCTAGDGNGVSARSSSPAAERSNAPAGAISDSSAEFSRRRGRWHQLVAADRPGTDRVREGGDARVPVSAPMGTEWVVSQGFVAFRDFPWTATSLFVVS